MVLKNEVNRYLQACLRWNCTWWDELFVYDDQSTDGTVGVCSPYTDNVIVRPDDAPSFLEDEGGYRSAAWAAMEDRCEPTEEDWVFALDSDEFLVGPGRPAYHRDLKSLAARAVEEGHQSIELQIPDIWDLDEMMVRKDGYWATMARPELIRYEPEWKFRNKKMGCGSGPEYSFVNPMRTGVDVTLLHFGHAVPEDRQERYDRYTALPNHGHNPKHINSIISGPALEKWEGPIPNVWRGLKADFVL